MDKKRLVVGLSGASGAILGIRLLQVVRQLGLAETHLVVSPAAREIIAQETDWPVSAVEALADQVYPHDDVGAAIASGSFRHRGMVIIPCSMGTLGRIAHGTSDDLITRAADVCLKERRKLILVPRETPFSLVHINNMKTVTEAGAIVLPAAPPFYHNPKSIMDLVDAVVGRILDHLGIDSAKTPRWRAEEE